MRQSMKMTEPHLRYRTKFTIEGTVDMTDKRFLRQGELRLKAKRGAKVGSDGAWHYPPQVKK